MKYRMEWQLKLKGNEKILFVSDFLSPESAIQAGEEIERTGKAAQLAFYDEIGTEWSLKEMKKLISEIEEKPHEISVYFDGGYKKESEEAGLGAVVYYRQGKKKYRIRTNQRIDELESNNEAEYAALYFSLGILEELEVQHLTCEFKGDSQVVLKQLMGDWPCYEELLNKWLDRIEEKIRKLGIYPKYTVIARNDNKEADKLASQALEGKIISAKTQLL